MLSISFMCSPRPKVLTSSMVFISSHGAHFVPDDLEDFISMRLYLQHISYIHGVSSIWHSPSSSSISAGSPSILSHPTISSLPRASPRFNTSLRSNSDCWLIAPKFLRNSLHQNTRGSSFKRRRNVPKAYSLFAPSPSLPTTSSTTSLSSTRPPPHQPLPSAKSRLGSTNPKPKIAFLFLTNSNLHFASLWEEFFSNGSKSTNQYKIYIHADPTVKINPPGGVFTDRFIPEKRTRQSSAMLIAAARRLLTTALLDDSRNAFFALLSKHCIPLHSFDFVYNTLFHLSIAELAQLGSLQCCSVIEISSKEWYLMLRYDARGGRRGCLGVGLRGG
ncbi:core-2/I-branching beta-1,6-N-acetylglucosaminyltransferase family protein [Actinidia rufa]|uniref:Core-2/I-branching beta-1,6-N-acetylglucosaminyltransferase family protein n=1 Tax=Actinidia rufa TaxID=165716 RepID=A0A7J0HBY6_9ERIC|nr:core-2/I-branching beta-1,6-N-acetylglucosaminyltransferase family protein [Actinidia rufa]